MTETLRRKLTNAGRVLAMQDQGDFVAGHVTVRLPDDPRRFLMKPATIGLDEMTPANIITVDLDGRKVGGTMPRQKPSSATGRRLSHHAMKITAASRPRSVGWSDMKPTRSQRVAPFDMWPMATTSASIPHAAASSHGASVSRLRRLSREHASSASTPITVRTSCWRRK